MRTIDTEELKKIQLGILDSIDAFCRKNKIKYWLDYGTLIGAVRHKGYIPWDDDVDIGMLRKDYDILVKKFNKKNSRYQVKDFTIDNTWHCGYGKVIDTKTIMYEPDEKTGIKTSVFIDIFIYDDLPNNEKLAKKVLKKRIILRKLHNLQTYKTSYFKHNNKYKFIRCPIHLLLQLFPKRYFLKQIVNMGPKYTSPDAKKVALITEYLDIPFDKSDFDEVVELKFEGRKYFAPKEYDKHLKLVYGDYMKLPPKNERISHHRYEAYYKD